MQSMRPGRGAWAGRLPPARGLLVMVPGTRSMSDPPPGGGSGKGAGVSGGGGYIYHTSPLSTFSPSENIPLDPVNLPLIPPWILAQDIAHFVHHGAF